MLSRGDSKLLAYLIELTLILHRNIARIAVEQIAGYLKSR